MISKASEAKTSFARVNKFLRSKTLTPINRIPERNDAIITVEDAVFEWEDEIDIDTDPQKPGDELIEVKVVGPPEAVIPMEDPDEEAPHESEIEEPTTNADLRFMLKDINLRVEEGELVALVGHVGAGMRLNSIAHPHNAPPYRKNLATACYPRRA